MASFGVFKTKYFWIVLIFILIAALAVDFSKVNFATGNLLSDLRVSSDACNITSNTFKVRGTSMAPLLQPDEEIIIHEGYYNCNPIKLNDIVAVRFSWRDNYVVKAVKGVPGDELRLEGANILVNNQIVKNSENQAYSLDARGAKMLSLYIKDYKEHIPGNAYLLLGDNPSGSFDSTRFGLMDKSQIEGKVSKIKK